GDVQCGCGLHQLPVSFNLLEENGYNFLSTGRLSMLGFLYSDSVDDVKGNQGFWDQALALEWINDNIRYLGGDPRRITIMGESAGSWSVSAHILSPVSRGLFQNAIMMSGSITYDVLLEPKQMVDKLLTGIRQVGCASES